MRVVGADIREIPSLELMIDGPEAWLSIPSLNCEGAQEYMWIGRDEGHLVSTMTLGGDPLRMVSIPVHFQELEPGLVEVRNAGKETINTHGIRRDGDILWWTIRGKDVAWRFIDAGSVPERARKVIARGREKLRSDSKQPRRDETS